VTSRTAWSIGVASVGLVVSVYLTATHYLAGQVPLVCVTNSIVDCAQVTTSAESMVGPLPVAVLGIVWFAAWLGLLAVARRIDGWPMRALLAWSVAGVLSVFYFVYAELFLIGAICLWCTVVHGAVIVLFLLAIAEATAPPEMLTPAPDLRAAPRRGLT
jgi:uncharacterized membrane protein